MCVNMYTEWTKHIEDTFLILSCIPFCLQNSLNSSDHGLYKVLKAFHRDAGPCWLQCFPQLCQDGWMSFEGWTILDTHRKLDFRKQQREHPPIHIEGTAVEKGESFKFPGVHITDKLKWSTHTDSVVKKPQQRLFNLRRLKKFSQLLREAAAYIESQSLDTLIKWITSHFKQFHSK